MAPDVSLTVRMIYASGTVIPLFLVFISIVQSLAVTSKLLSALSCIVMFPATSKVYFLSAHEGRRIVL